MAERMVNESEKYEVIGDGSVVVGMEGGMALDGGGGIFMYYVVGNIRDCCWYRVSCSFDGS